MICMRKSSYLLVLNLNGSRQREQKPFIAIYILRTKSCEKERNLTLRTIMVFKPHKSSDKVKPGYSNCDMV